jgi:hypothetical protein
VARPDDLLAWERHLIGGTNRLANSRWPWWTRRVGGWTFLCFQAYAPSGALGVYETVIGRPPVTIRGVRYGDGSTWPVVVS